MMRVHENRRVEHSKNHRHEIGGSLSGSETQLFLIPRLRPEHLTTRFTAQVVSTLFKKDKSKINLSDW